MEINTVNHPQDPLETPQHQPSQENIINQKGFFPIVIGVIILLLAVAGGTYYLGARKNSVTSQYNQQITISPNPNVSTQKQANGFKIYTNDYYHFKLELPNDWMIQQSLRSDGSPIAELSSSNKQIVIYVNYDFGATHIDQELPHQPDVQLGQYKVYRSRYISGGKTIDYINLYNVPDQRPLLLTFDISGDFDQNNAALLKVLNSFAFTQKELGITSYFTYALPQGWNKVRDDYQGASFTSADHKTDEHVGYTIAGVQVSVIRNIMSPDKTLQDVVNEFPDKNTNDTKPIVIDGLNGLTRHSNWESHAQAFLVIKDKYLWEIWVTTANLTDENNHRQEIDAFVNSIKFK